MAGDFVPTVSEAKELAERKAVWSFTFCSVHSDPKKAGNYCCQIIDSATTQVLSESYGRSHQESFDGAYKALPKRSEVDNPQTVAAMREELERLKAELAKPASPTRNTGTKTS
jgi:hypothetical protein